jgi:hypothetical protein
MNGSVGQTVPYFNPKRDGLSPIYTTPLAAWKKACPTLSTVVFPNGSIWICDGTAQWRCQNMWAPRRNRTKHTFYGRIEGAEPWSTPMFERDLKREWPTEDAAEARRALL